MAGDSIGSRRSLVEIAAAASLVRSTRLKGVVRFRGVAVQGLEGRALGLAVRRWGISTDLREVFPANAFSVRSAKAWSAPATAALARHEFGRGDDHHGGRDRNQSPLLPSRQFVLVLGSAHNGVPQYISRLLGAPELSGMVVPQTIPARVPPQFWPGSDRISETWAFSLDASRNLEGNTHVPSNVHGNVGQAHGECEREC